MCSSRAPEEDRATEAFLGASLPTREETQEIEFSSRFYTEDGAVYMTASLLTGIDIAKPILTPFTIVVAGDRVVTLRYEDLRAFRQFLSRASKPGAGCHNTAQVFLGLIEAIVDRTADVLERISADVDRINREIFAERKDTRQRAKRLEVMIEEIGFQGDLAAKARESLASLERLIQFAGLALPGPFAKGPSRARLKLAGRDIRSLEDQVTFPFQQDHLSARCHPRPDLGAAERGDPHPDGGDDGLLPADADRHRLRHELQVDSRAQLGLGLPLCHCSHGDFGGVAVPLLQAKRVAVGWRSDPFPRARPSPRRTAVGTPSFG